MERGGFHEHLCSTPQDLVTDQTEKGKEGEKGNETLMFLVGKTMRMGETRGEKRSQKVRENIPGQRSAETT